MRAHLVPGTGFFEPTPQWDKEHSVDRLWSMAPPRKSGTQLKQKTERNR